jgi:ribosomal protein S12 methylthiotransferase
VLVDAVDQNGAIARSHWDAPKIDGQVYLNDSINLEPGGFFSAFVEAADAYDLYARRVKAEAAHPVQPVTIGRRAFGE